MLYRPSREFRWHSLLLTDHAARVSFFKEFLLNQPKINWHTNVGSHHDVYTLFLSHVIESSYCQLVSFPTRDASILDVILTSDASVFSAIEPDLPNC